MSFTLLRAQQIPELAATARIYIHDGTGARLLTVSNSDENKCFGVSFRTPNQDSTGVAHILEHSVLCGSQKYPVKEPFVEIIKSSLQTFVNAFTYPDKTCYPCASTNLQDLRNLIDIYLDAVFFPNITELTFKQEGWHYEVESPSGPLSFKGVVFNEMKGAYSSPDDLLGDKSRQSLFPQNTYRFDAGGDPQFIPDLTYAQFKAYHQTFYHPSNSYIFFYGDDPEEQRLQLLEPVLSRFSKINPQSAIENQPAFTTPSTYHYVYDSGESADAKAHLTINWKLTAATDLGSSLAFSLIDHLLLGTAAAPIKRVLTESGLGEEVIGGFDDQLKETIFSIGLKGIQPENLAKVEALILKTLEETVQNGLDPESVSASLNTLEFHIREQNSGRFPRGLALMLGALSTWLYEGDPIEAISYEASLAELKSFALQKGAIETKIKQWLIDNQHRTTVQLLPDEKEGKRRESLETDRLEKVMAGLTPAELRSIANDADLLKLHQDTPDSDEALASIPSLSLADLDRSIKTSPFAEHGLGGNKVFHQVLETNGIAYIDIGFDLSGVPSRLLPYLGLLGKLLTELGTESYDMLRLTQKIGQDTGGLRASQFISEKYDRSGQAKFSFIRGKALQHQIGAMLDLVLEISQHAKLDQKERFLQIVAERRSALESGLIPGGSNVIHQRLKAHFSQADRALEEISGINQILFLRQLSDIATKDWDAILSDLRNLFGSIFSKNNAIANVTIDEHNWPAAAAELQRFFASLPDQQIPNQKWDLPALPRHEVFTLPSQVNYVGSAIDLYGNGYSLDGNIHVINNYLQTTYLWEKVRVQGGAYGGFSAFDPITGIFDFLSYRDPNAKKTLETYDKTGEFLQKLEIGDSELEKTIIGTIGDVDTYLLPDAKGWQSFTRSLLSLSNEERQNRRDQIFASDGADFGKFGQVLHNTSNTQHVVVLGSVNAADELNQLHGETVVVTKLL